jgi:hypothetical protein
MRRPVLAVLALLASATLLVAAGCGAGDPESQDALIPAERVITHFERETGRPLEPTPEPDVAWEQLGYGLDPSPELLELYGTFSVYVAKEGHLQALDSLLKDKATKKALERDAQGVYWELDSNSRTWVAYKRYARNVVLVWLSGSKEREVDARFERLDDILADL